MTPILENYLSTLIRIDKTIKIITNINDLNNFKSRTAFLLFELSPKSHQITVFEIILFNSNTGEKYKLESTESISIVKKTGLLDTHIPPIENAKDVILRNAYKYDYLIETIDGISNVYKIDCSQVTELLLEQEKKTEQIEISNFVDGLYSLISDKDI